METDSFHLPPYTLRVCSQALCTKYSVISPKGFLYSLIANLAEKHQICSISNEKAIYVIFTSKQFQESFQRYSLRWWSNFYLSRKSWSLGAHIHTKIKLVLRGTFPVALMSSHINTAIVNSSLKKKKFWRTRQPKNSLSPNTVPNTSPLTGWIYHHRLGSHRSYLATYFFEIWRHKTIGTSTT